MLNSYYLKNLGGDHRRWSSLRTMLNHTKWLIPVTFLGVGWLLAPGRGERVAKGLAILLFLPPLYEIFAKFCVPYHWSQELLGIAFLGAMGLHWLSSASRSPDRWWLAIGGFVAVAWLAGELDARSTYRSYREAYRLSREFAPVMIRGRWDDPSVERSRYLEIAKYIRDNTNPDDRIVVSGNLEVLFSLSDRLPPAVEAADLMVMTAAESPVRRPEMVELLREYPPRLVVERLQFPFDFTDFWPDFTARYRLARTFPVDEEKHYGQQAIRVWLLKE